MKSEKFEMNNAGIYQFDYTKLHQYTHEDYKMLLICIGEIAHNLCVWQHLPLERMYEIVCAYNNELKDNRTIFDDAILLCLSLDIANGIDDNNLLYQTNSVQKEMVNNGKIKSFQQLSQTIVHSSPWR